MASSFEDSPKIVKLRRKVMRDYGVNVSTDLKDKDVDKFGRVNTLGTTRRTIHQLGVQETLPVIGDNPIDAVSSSNAADVGLTVTYEGLYYENGLLKFGTGSSVLNGQNNVALNRGYNEVTRTRVLGQPAGDVWIGKGNALTGGVPADVDKHNVVRGTLGLRQSYKAQTSFSYRDWGFVTGLDVSLGRASGSNQGVDFELETAERVSSGQPVFFPVIGTVTLLTAGTSSKYIPLDRIIPSTNYVRVSGIGTTSGMNASATIFATIAIDRALADD